MSNPKISIIAAIQKKDRGLGNDNQLLFRISEDLKRFKSLTTGHPIIMGRKTFESIGRPLPNRTNIVITRNPEWQQEGIITASSLQDAFSKTDETDEIFIIGGGEIYAQTAPLADRLYLTIVDGDKPADTFFPSFEMFTKEIERINATTEDGLEYEFVTLEK